MSRERHGVGRRRVLAMFAASAASVAVPRRISAAAGSLNAFLDACFQEHVRADPRSMAMQGIPGRESELGAFGSRAARQAAVLARRQLAALHARFAQARLDPVETMSYRLFEREQRRIIADERWWAYYSPISALSTPLSELIEYLVSGRPVHTPADARAYVRRLRATRTYLTDVAADLDTIGRLGLAPPRSVMPAAVAGADDLLAGPPFAATGRDQLLWADFTRKLATIAIADADRASLAEEARAALLGPFRSGLTAYRAAVGRLAARATNDDGLWSKPDGEAFYAWVLRNSTTTTLSADAIHHLGLSEVRRIRALIDGLRPAFGSAGSVDALLADVRASPRQRYPAGDAGRELFLAEANGLLPAMVERLPDYFHVPPTRAPAVLAVPAWQEATSAPAFFRVASGARPATVFFNLAHVDRLLRPQVETTVYHESIPGHFLQDHYVRAIRDLPRFRTAGPYGGLYYDAWSEGWAVYAEGLAVEMGFCRDPSARLGQLTAELYRAARLVVDTGLHARRWPRAQAIDYLYANSLTEREGIEREIDRYLSFPGQATSYKIGQLKILDIRQRMKNALGDRFDIRDFHARFLDHGPLPLDFLESEMMNSNGVATSVTS